MSGFRAVLERINLRHFAERRLRTLLTLLGVAAGVALTFSVSVINSTVLASMRASGRAVAGTADIEVAAPDFGGLPDDAIAGVRRVPGVERVAPVVRGISELTGPRGTLRFAVFGVTEDFPSLFPAAGGDLAITGDAGPDGRGLVLPPKVLEAVGARVGDRVGISTARGRVSVTVTGTVSGRAVEAVNGGDIGAMALDAARALFERPGLVDAMYVVVSPDASVAMVEAAIARALAGAAVVGPPGTRVGGFERILDPLIVLISLAGTVAIFVSLFVVYNAMSMSLVERRREISLALALGTSRRQLLAAFVAEAGVLGAAASAMGIGFGLGLARMLVGQALDATRFLPVAAGGSIVVRPSHIVLAAAGGIGVSLVGAFVPARRVTRVAPIESLRPAAPYEWETADAGRPRKAATALGVVLVVLGVVGILAIGIADSMAWAATVAILAWFAGVTLLMPGIVPQAVRLMRPALVRVFGTVGRLASDSLTKNPARTTFTVAALVLTLAMVIGVGSGLQAYVGQAHRLASTFVEAPLYVDALSDNGFNAELPLSVDLAQDISRVDGVRFVYPENTSWVRIGELTAAVYTTSVAEAVRSGAPEAIGDRSVSDDADAHLRGLSRGEVSLSYFTAERLGVRPGSSVSIATPAGRREFRVASRFETFSAWDALEMDYSTYRRIWGDDSADRFGVLLSPGAGVADVKRRLEALVADLGVPARVITRAETITMIMEALNRELDLSRGIQLAAIVVAALTIANTIFTTVLERRWEMGLQRAVGMSRGQVGRSVSLEAAGIGLLGGIGASVLGTAFGYLFTTASATRFAWHIPYEPPWALWLLAVAGAIAVAALAASYPRRLAVRTPIMEALRYE